MDNDWKAYQFLLGEWEGGNERDPVPGKGAFSFSFALDAADILVRNNRTVIPLTSDREGYPHDDLLIIYNQDTGLKRAIYFDNEEHMIHDEVSVAPDQKTIAIVSDPIPSAPRFRFTYLKAGENTLDGRFEIASPGQPEGFQVYIEGTARRIG